MILFIHPIKPELIERLRTELNEEIIVKGSFDEVGLELSSAEIIVSSAFQLNTSLFERCHNLRWFHSVSAGVEDMPFELFDQKGIILTNSRGIHGHQMAEQIFGMMISFTRGLHYNLKNQLKQKWELKYPVRQLRGSTICIVGVGSIGREVARKAKAFDMFVIGVRNTERPVENCDSVVSTNKLRDVLKESDFVVVLTPLTPATYHLIGEKELESMKPSGILINFARGDVVDERALIQALKNQTIGGAGLDVFHTEPLPEDSVLWSMENVLISPHYGGFAPLHGEYIVDAFVENYWSYRRKDPMPGLVDLKKKY